MCGRRPNEGWSLSSRNSKTRASPRSRRKWSSGTAESSSLVRVRGEEGNSEGGKLAHLTGRNSLPAERQKLLRKIKQAKKQLAEVPESADAQRALLEARIDLYYVLVRQKETPDFSSNRQRPR